MPVSGGEPDISPQHLLDVKERELEKLKDGVSRLKDLSVIGDVTKPEYKARLERLKDLTVKKENEVEQLKESLSGRSPLTHAERLQRIEALKAAWETIDISPMERNRPAKQIMERIEYTRNETKRNGTVIQIQVKFR